MSRNKWGMYLVALLLLSGCTKSNTQQTAKKAVSGPAHQLSIISPHPKVVQNEWVPEFKKFYKEKTGIEVNVEWISQGGTVENLRFIENEFLKHKSGIGVDVFWGGGVGPHLKLASMQRLNAYKLPDSLLNKIPQNISGIPVYDKNHQWYGCTLATFGFLINKAILKKHNLPFPKTWKDLAHPRYQGHIVSADPRRSGVAHMVFSIILQAYPWKEAWRILTGISANTREYSRYAKNVINIVTTGDASIGMAIDHYAAEAVAKHGKTNFAFVLPKDATVVSPDAVSILKGAPNKKVAQAFLEFLLSPEYQKMWLLPVGAKGGPKGRALGRIPVVSQLLETFQAQSIVTANPFKLKTAFKYDSEKGKRLWSLLNDLIGALLIDNNDHLKRTWHVLRKKGFPENRLRILGSIPLSEKEALGLSEKWKDPIIRNKKVAEWQKFARQKYDAALLSL